jgi:hypothetical protein
MKKISLIFMLFMLINISASSQETNKSDVKNMFVGKWHTLFSELESYDQSGAYSSKYEKNDAIMDFRSDGICYHDEKKYATWVLENDNLLIIDKGLDSERYFVIISISDGFLVRKGPFYSNSPRVNQKIYTLYEKKVKQ